MTETSQSINQAKNNNKAPWTIPQSLSPGDQIADQVTIIRGSLNHGFTAEAARAIAVLRGLLTPWWDEKFDAAWEYRPRTFLMDEEGPEIPEQEDLEAQLGILLGEASRQGIYGRRSRPGSTEEDD